MPGCVIILPKTVSKRLDLSFGIFARRGEKYSCYTLILRFASPAGRVCGVATHSVGGNAGYGLLRTGRGRNYCPRESRAGGKG
ncbi:hypothetical protein A6J88_11505 [Neisseria mucosa]|uniref:Uncharacterized protein n=1 Tax=Neisseria mucosa TaxID=488 RepID=A0ABM6JDK0_NEIMU|nr:hypothetical protein A6J88_11505 [Neisseria mucosa]